MGRKISWSNSKVEMCVNGIENSKTPKMYMQRAELFKYCPVGLTGSVISSSNPSIFFFHYLTI